MYHSSDYFQNMLIYPAQTDIQNTGNLQIHCLTHSFIPAENVSVQIAATADPGKIIHQCRTNQSGLTDNIVLPAPAIGHSLDPASAKQPYSEYNITIIAGGYAPIHINNVEVLPSVTALQNITLNDGQENACALYSIPPHTLYGEYPAKIKESETKNIDIPEGMTASRVVMPEFIIVHDGHPMDASAPNYYVRFRDYIKNVVSSEIYPTWPEAAIYANALATISFTLNRIYTEWYKKKGYDFTVTSATDYDQKWINGRNIYQNISLAVDDLFINYLSRPNITQPILTLSCNTDKEKYPNSISPWESKTLGERGFSTIQILKHFFGENIYINKTEKILGIQNSWPGTNLLTGSFGKHVKIMQRQLNRIAENFTAIPRIIVDGHYDYKTAYAARIFQIIFHLPETGIIDLTTWYKICSVFSRISRMEKI